MGTVTQFPAMDLKASVGILGQITVTEIEADIVAEVRRLNAATALEALTNVSDLVAITIRRELGERVWDITIQSLYYTAKEPDAAGHRPQLTSYVWDAEECAIGEGEADEWAMPDEIMCREHFATAAEALADAEGDLAQREAA